MNADLTLDDLRAYRDGRLSDAERLRIEALLRSEPFYADALDGLDALLKTGQSPAKPTEALRAALHERVKRSASKKRLWHLWMAALIACILLMLSVAVYLIFVAGR